MGVSNVPAASAAGLQPKYQKFTSSGTFTLPTGYGVSKPLLINIQVIGGGGGGSSARLTANNTYNKNTSYTGTFSNYFGNATTLTINAVTGPTSAAGAVTGLNNFTGNAGGSGGIAATQMYLTSNLSITVGAAGARASNATINDTSGFFRQNFGNFGDNYGSNTSQIRYFANNSGTNDHGHNSTQSDIVLGAVVAVPSGGSRGTTTAGSVSSTGGSVELPMDI